MQIFVKYVIDLAETHYCVFQIQVIAIFITTFRKSNKCRSFYHYALLSRWKWQHVLLAVLFQWKKIWV